jgi:hypothetical protein
VGSKGRLRFVFVALGFVFIALGLVVVALDLETLRRAGAACGFRAACPAAKGPAEVSLGIAQGTERQQRERQ